MRLAFALALAAALLPPAGATAQSVKVVNPATGLPVFSAANPAPVYITGGELPVTSTVAVSQATPGSTNAVVGTFPGQWSYAAASGGIANTTTAVTIKASAGASTCNLLKTLTIGHDALGGATELAVRDGAGGTVKWRGKLQTTATEDRQIQFEPPLKGSAATLLEVVTLTGVTGGVFVNATGYTVAC